MLGEVLALQKAGVAVTVLMICGALTAADELWLKDEKSRAVWGMALLLVLLGGYGRMEMEKNWARERLDFQLDGKSLWLDGRAKQIFLDEKKVQIVLERAKVWDQLSEIVPVQENISGEEGKNCRGLGQVFVYLDALPAGVQEGDRLLIHGEMKACEGASNPGEFDFQLYNLGLNSCYQMYGDGGEETVRVVKEAGLVSRSLARIREKGGGILDSLMEEKDAGVLKAMVLGDKTGMDPELKNLYQKNGIAHILAISGLHISLLGAGIYRLLRKAGAGFGVGAAAGSLLLILYGLMTGFSSSSFRAVTMMILFFLSEYLGRTYDMASAAGWAAILLLLHSPFLILQSGFQLSFGAVASISLLGRFLEQEIQPKQGICQQAVMGAAVQIGTFPIVLYHFYEYPVYGFLLNLAVIPLMSYVAVSGIGGILLGGWAPVLGKGVLGTCHYILFFYEKLCMGTAKLPWANQIMGRPKTWQLGLYGILLAGGLVFLKKRSWKNGKEKGLCLCGLCVCLFLALHPAARFMEKENLVITFLDVGQGDGILVEQGGTVLLIDGGSTDQKKLGEQSLVPCLKSKGIRRIDYALVSHGDEDHISGLGYLLENDTGIQVDTLLLPALGKEEESQKKLAAAQMGRQAVVREMKAGDGIKAGKMELLCLYPGEEDQAEGKNQQSLVCMLSFFGLDVLFTGDTEQVCEQIMGQREEVREVLKKTDVLKVAHHGSDSATSEEFLALLDDQTAYGIISCGEKNNPTTKMIQA